MTPLCLPWHTLDGLGNLFVSSIYMNLTMWTHLTNSPKMPKSGYDAILFLNPSSLRRTITRTKRERIIIKKIIQLINNKKSSVKNCLAMGVTFMKLFIQKVCTLAYGYYGYFLKNTCICYNILKLCNRSFTKQFYSWHLFV